MSREHRSPSPAAEAGELEALAETYPEERADLLFEAAGAWDLAGEHDRAAALFRAAAAAGYDPPAAAEAFAVASLFDAGRTAEAREAAEGLRRSRPQDAEVWEIIGEVYEERRELRTAQEWYTAGITRILGPAAPLTMEAVGECRDPFGAENLAIGRRRVRREAGEPEDEMDALAEALFIARRHEPGAEDLLDSDDDPWSGPPEYPEEAEGEGPSAAISALFWPRAEFDRLITDRPDLAEHYGTDHGEHIAGVQRRLRQASAEGLHRLAVGRGSVEDFERFLAEEGGPQVDGQVLAHYGAEIARQGRSQAWPPPRNAPCWCGSSRKYKKCCGSPSRS